MTPTSSAPSIPASKASGRGAGGAAHSGRVRRAGLGDLTPERCRDFSCGELTRRNTACNRALHGGSSAGCLPLSLKISGTRFTSSTPALDGPATTTPGSHPVQVLTPKGPGACGRPPGPPPGGVQALLFENG